jgi:nucleoside-diphosphate-sugar epimerase
MKIAITGASGDIGARLLARLHDAGVPCRGLVRHTSPRLARRPELEVRHVDLTDPASLASALADCTVVIHTALDQKNAAPRLMVANNVGLLPPLVNACRRLGIKRFIHLSSIVTVPPRITPEAVARDDYFSTERNWYSKAKVASEKWLRQNATDLDFCLIRAGLVYGPYMNWTRHAISKLQAGTILLPVGPDAPCYAVHVDDICDLLFSAVTHAGPLPRLIYGINPEPATWPQFFGGLAAGSGLSHPAVERRTLPELQAGLTDRKTLRDTVRPLVRWLWNCPLVPFSVKISGPTQVLIRMVRRKGAGRETNRNRMPIQPSPRLVWPDRFELETYLSTALFTPSQTGAGLGFTYQRPLASGLPGSIAWWRGDLAALFNHSRL